MNLRFAPYCEGDEDKILELFESVFGRPMSMQFWRWRQQENPAGGPYTEMVWDGDKLIGHYAVSAANLCVNGEAIPVGLSMTTMVHSDYRGQNIFERSAESIYDRLAATGVKAVYGFPNNLVHRPRIQKIAWKDIYEIPTLVLDLAGAQQKPSNAQEVKEFDASFDRLWQRVKDNFPLSLWRDNEFLTWRFSQNPINQYTIAVIPDGDEILGYMVARPYGDQGLDIIDFVVECDAAAVELIAWAIAFGNGLNLQQLNTWAPTGSKTRVQLDTARFVPQAPVTYLGGRPFTDLNVDFSDHRNWFFSMADSDIY